MANDADDANHIVTDHAVVRFLERILGVDVEAVRAQIVADGRAALVRRIAHGKIRSEALRAKLTVKNGVVVTVTPYTRDGRDK